MNLFGVGAGRLRSNPQVRVGNFQKGTVTESFETDSVASPSTSPSAKWCAAQLLSPPALADKRAKASLLGSND